MSRTASSTMGRAGRFGFPIAGLLAFVSVWGIAVSTSGTTVFPSPADVLRGVVELARRGALVPYILDSLGRVGSGYGLALLVGIPAGVVLGSSRVAFGAVNPAVQLLRPISPLAWIPFSIVMFGVGGAAAVFLIFLASLFPVMLATAHAVDKVPDTPRLAGRNFGLGRVAVFRRIVLPAALPRILVGLRIALGVAWLVVVAAEMIAVDSGLGYMILDARNAGKRYDLVVAGMLLIGLMGLLLDLVFRGVERLPAVRWAFRAGS